MIFLRSALFALIFYAWTAIAVLLSFPISLLGTRALRSWAQFWARGHRLCARLILGIRTRLEGERPNGPALVAVKHQSMYETLEMLLMLHEPAVVLKRELTQVPFWGWVVRQYGVIAIDRSGGASELRKMMRSAKEAIAEGRPILIFPEGTRVAPGTTPPLLSGFAGLYRAVGLPVVPVALNSGLLSPKGSFLKRPGTITFRFMPAIQPGLGRDDIEREVHEAINVLEPSH